MNITDCGCPHCQDLCPCGYRSECPIWCGDGTECDRLADDGRFHEMIVRKY